MSGNTVWILGAGFSRPLGGPLLRDLLTRESVANILAAFPGYVDQFKGHHRERVLNLYADHKYQDERTPGQRLWRDAEEFIDYIDTAAFSGGPARTRLQQLLGADDHPDLVKTFAWAARGLVAAECAAFLVGADPSTERWEPYRRWFGSLGADDTVITFNYDLVLEKLEKHNRGRIHVVLPGDPASGKLTQVLKLHGSVDWKRIDGRDPEFESDQSDTFPLDASADELAVATPGPTKAARAKELEELWAKAETAIRQATAVVFVGYRFPPSDAAARLRLLRALASNSAPYLAVHSVLGPRLRDDDPVRMVELLKHAMLQANRSVAPYDQVHAGRSGGRFFTVLQHPLWAEDFLGYVAGGHITQANLHFRDEVAFGSRPKVSTDR